MGVEGSINRAQSNLFILVGLPGSGKSWFSQVLVIMDPQDWCITWQDGIDSHSQGESAISRRTRPRFTILDRCNISDVERMKWLKLASNWAVSPVCVWFDYVPESCASRVQMRVGHPTLPPGSCVQSAVSQMQKHLVEPKLSEGISAIARIKSFKAVHELVHFLVPLADHPIKLPRITHLIDVGGTPPHDIVSSDYIFTQSAPCCVVVTEKVDGANIWISLLPDRSRIMVQDRSHWVNPTSHEQFKKLRWIEEHRSELYEILDHDEHYAERYILYGEWMYTPHSITYTYLPDVFVALDLYGRSTSEFVNRASLEAMLRGTSIMLVPVRPELKHQLLSRAKLLEFIETQSQFYDGKVEGVVVKSIIMGSFMNGARLFEVITLQGTSIGQEDLFDLRHPAQ